MSDGEYDGGMTAGGRWGCAAAVFLGFPLFFVLMIGDAMGDCIPEEPCRKGFLPYVFSPTAIIALVVGLGIRAIVNSAKRNNS